MSRTFVFAEWLYEIVKLHFFWVVYIFKGFVVAGVFPSVAAVYATIRHWQLKRESRSVSELFKQYYEENFKVANIFGWMFLSATAILVLNFLYIPLYPETVRMIMYAVILFLALLLLIGWIYVFPIVVHYKLPISSLFVAILKAGFASLTGMIMQILFACIFILIVYKLPAFFVLFGIIPLSLVQIAISLNVFDKLK